MHKLPQWQGKVGVDLLLPSSTPSLDIPCNNPVYGSSRAGAVAARHCSSQHSVIAQLPVADLPNTSRLWCSRIPLDLAVYYYSWGIGSQIPVCGANSA